MCLVALREVKMDLFTVTPYRRFRLHGGACGNGDGEDALK